MNEEHMNEEQDDVQQEPVAVKYLGELQRLVLKPEDILVLSVDSKLSSETLHNLKTALREAIYPADNRVIVLSSGMKLGVVGIE